MAAHLFRRPWVPAVTVAALVLGLVQSVTAQAPEDPWTKARERVEPGERVIFEVAGSPRQTGLLQSISAEGLTVMVAGQTSQVRREDVSRLWKDGDSNLNGFLIGAGSGALVVGASMAAACSEGHPSGGDCSAGTVFWITGLYAGLGSLISRPGDRTNRHAKPYGRAGAPRLVIASASPARTSAG